MQYDDGGDHSDFWGDDQPTRQLRRVHPGTREHTGSIPIVPSLRRARDTAHESAHDPARHSASVTAQRGTAARTTRPNSRRDDMLAAVSPRRSAFAATSTVDPLLRRLGIVVGAIVVLIPLAMTLRDDATPTLRSADVAAPTVTPIDAAAATPTSAPVAAAAPTVDVAALPAITPAPAPSFPDAADLPPAVPVHTQPATTVPTSAPATPSAASSGDPSVPTASTVLGAAEAETNGKACSVTYTVVSGDFWISIAKRAQVPLKDLLKVNKATTSTKLFPGRTICLPKAAVTPVPAATPAPTTTVKPTKTTTPTTSPKSTPKAPTTPAPTTTVKPTPTTTPSAPAPRNTYTREQVAQIIRDVWPDDLEDEAIRIATRESNLIPTVRNYCCFGLFQIYYSVHKRWLADLGITSADMLYDPRANATAALALYIRGGGWGPWAL